MKYFKRMFCTDYYEARGLEDDRKMALVFEVDVINELRIVPVEKEGYRKPYTFEVYTAFGRFLKEYERYYREQVGVRKRESCYRYCSIKTEGGGEQIVLEENMVNSSMDGFPDRKVIIEESCHGEMVGYICCDVYDFIGLCCTNGLVGVVKGMDDTDNEYYYEYKERKDSNRRQNMDIVRPRVIEDEKGWMSGHAVPIEVVELEEVREAEDCDEEYNRKERVLFDEVYGP